MFPYVRPEPQVSIGRCRRKNQRSESIFPSVACLDLSQYRQQFGIYITVVCGQRHQDSDAKSPSPLPWPCCGAGRVLRQHIGANGLWVLCNPGLFLEEIQFDWILKADHHLKPARSGDGEGSRWVSRDHTVGVLDPAA